MAGEPILPGELWLISCDGRACFNWSPGMVECYLPNITANITRVSRLGFGQFFQTNAGGAIGITVEGVSSDVLTKIDEYMRFLFREMILWSGSDMSEKFRYIRDWLVVFLSNLDADMMKKLKSETEKRRVQLEAAGRRTPPGYDSPMQLLADYTANLCSICVDQQPAQIRAMRNPEDDTYLTKVVAKIRQERGTERGYFGNV